MNYENLSENVKIKTISDNGIEGVFHIEGLFPGYGLTLGNSLRRSLFSSLPGAAVTQFKVKGVLHEFSTIPGVLEDAVEIGMNLKKLRFRLLTDEPQVLTIQVKGEKEITGADIKSDAKVEIINPEIKLFTITDKKTSVEMELIVEKGLGYVPVERRRAGKLDIGVMALDAIFTPVTNVSFNIENMRVGDRTDYNRLELVVCTDGSITPKEAVKMASQILIEHFTKISVFNNEGLENSE